MIVLFLMLLNTLACFLIFVVAGSFLIARDPPKDIMQGVAQIGLLLTMVGSFVTGVAPFIDVMSPGWWSVMLRTGVAMIALQQYDRAYGLRRQWLAFIDNITAAPVQLAAWWHRKLHIAQKQAQSQSRHR